MEQSDSVSSIVYPADGLTLPMALEVLQAPMTDDESENGEKDNFLDENKMFVELSGVRGGEALVTTRKELFAWWLYYFSYAPVGAVGMVLLIPLLLQDFARRAGHVLGDFNRACDPNDPGEVCVLWSLGEWSVTPSAFAYYVIGLSVASQALVFISVGALADYGRMRKGMLCLCTWLGSFTAVCMLLVRGPAYVYLAALLTVVLNIFYGTASVFYNAYLPLLVQNHPKYLVVSRATDKPEGNESGNGITIISTQQRKIHKIGEKLSSFISTMGIASGYSAGVVSILAVILYFQVFGTRGSALQICIAACGVWWLGVSAVSFVYLRVRPGPELPTGSNYLSFSWKKLGRTLQKCRRLPTTFSFLSCYFFYSDGFNTMGSAAILIARQSLNVGIEKLTLCALIAPICALFGTIFFFFLQRTFKIPSKTMLIGILCLMGCIPLYCSMGLVSTSFGLRREWEIYAITSVYGLIIGAAQSFSRVLFAELIPIGEESEFFSLYAITDKGSAFLGPMVIAILSDYFNEPRYGLLFLAALILIPIPLIYSKVNLTKGKQECMEFKSNQQ